MLHYRELVNASVPNKILLPWMHFYTPLPGVIAILKYICSHWRIENSLF